jgi:hypothetical protein
VVTAATTIMTIKRKSRFFTLMSATVPTPIPAREAKVNGAVCQSKTS